MSDPRHFWYAKLIDSEGFPFRYTKGSVGCVIAASIVAWQVGVYNRTLTSYRDYFPDKMLKYLAFESGGGIIYPFTILFEMGLRTYQRTEWKSFEHRSYYPHSDKFKVKVAVVEDDLGLLKTVVDRKKHPIDAVVDDHKGVTALGLAAVLGRLQVIEYLVDLGASLDAVGRHLETPLMKAVVHRQLDAIKLLVNLGSDINAVDEFGYTAADKARNRGYNNIAEYLDKCTQQERPVNVNPITPKLESYSFLKEDSPLSFTKQTDISSLYIGQVYPFYAKSQGFLLYFFGNYTVPSLDTWLKPYLTINTQDDKGSSDQDLLTFGKMIEEKTTGPPI
jgi:hypothetical protein